MSLFCFHFVLDVFLHKASSHEPRTSLFRGHYSPAIRGHLHFYCFPFDIVGDRFHTYGGNLSLNWANALAQSLFTTESQFPKLCLLSHNFAIRRRAECSIVQRYTPCSTQSAESPTNKRSNFERVAVSLSGGLYLYTYVS